MANRRPSILSTILGTAGRVAQVGLNAVTSAPQPRRKKGLKGCQPCEVQRKVDQVMREVRGR